MDAKVIFNTFKKETKKEGRDLTGRCYMNAKQVAARTATIYLTCAQSFEDRIAWEKKGTERIMGYNTWTDEEKAKAKKRHDEIIAATEKALSKYGTRANQAKAEFDEIVATAAFKKLCDSLGGASFSIDTTKEAYYLRINY